MTGKVKLVLLTCVAAINLGAAGNLEAAATAQSGIEEFNQALLQATTHMDNAASLALWEDEGIALLPQTKPIVGKKALGKFLDDVTSQMPGARMAKFEMKCFDIEATSDWATEWCEEHQRVILPAGSPFEGWGKMLLVLHRGADGKWRMRREMWNQGLAENPSR